MKLDRIASRCLPWISHDDLGCHPHSTPDWTPSCPTCSTEKRSVRFSLHDRLPLRLKVPFVLNATAPQFICEFLPSPQDKCFKSGNYDSLGWQLRSLLHLSHAGREPLTLSPFAVSFKHHLARSRGVN